MSGPRPGLFPSGLFPSGLLLSIIAGCGGCAGPAPFAWSTDLAGTLAAAGGDELIVVQFTVAPRGGTPVEAAVPPAAAAGGAPEPVVLPHCRGVRLDARVHRRLHREIFDPRPGAATCVLTRDGICLAACSGIASGADLAAMVERAERSRPAITRLTARLRGLAVDAPRETRLRLAAELAEACLAAGDPFAAYRHFTLVTLLAPPGSGRRPEVLRACERLARLEIEWGRSREAREWLDELGRRDPEALGRAGSRLTQAILARVEQRLADAAAALQVLRDDPNPTEPDRILVASARVCRDGGDLPAAGRYYRRVVAEHPGSPWSRVASRELGDLPAPPRNEPEPPPDRVPHRAPGHPPSPGGPMDPDAFHASLERSAPDPDLPPALAVLWHDRRGDWERAHEIAQDLPDPDGAWLHAYLHRREGDLANAGYWYRRAGRRVAQGPLDAEWSALVEHFAGG